MRILYSLAGTSLKASSRVRGYWVAEELIRLGHVCTLMPQLKRSDIIKLAREIIRHDVIIFQKTYGRYDNYLQSFAIALGKATYVDIDDAPSLNNDTRTLRRFEMMVEKSNAIFAGSQMLLDYTKKYNINSHKIPSSIKLCNYKGKEPSTEAERGGKVCLGWIGNGAHYGIDLKTILQAPLEALSKSHQIKLKIVGVCENPVIHNTFSNIAGLDYEGIDTIEWANPVAVAEHLKSFDIGLYPLIQNSFNSFKCGFKALEYMASGQPVVSSDVAMNRDIVINNKNGYLVNSSAEWIRALEELIYSAELRNQMGIAGRKLVESKYSTEAIAKNISDILTNRHTLDH